MTVEAELKKIVINNKKLQLTLNINCDAYDYQVHSPKISLIFQTEGDMRRIPMPVELYESTKDGCRIFGNYSYLLDNIFWNIIWDTCLISVDLEYGKKHFQQVPLQIKCKLPENPTYNFNVQEHGIQLKLKTPIDCQSPKDPNLFDVITSSFCHMITGIIGIFLLPWFAIDSLLIIFSRTEKENQEIQGSFMRRFLLYVGCRYSEFCRNTPGITGAKSSLLKTSFFLFNSIHHKKYKILFFSTRHTDLSGNFEFVFNQIKREGKQKACVFWLDTRTTRKIPVTKLLKLGMYLAEAKIILVDDYTPILDQLDFDPQTKIIQLWHACGAFKTFGFSRLEKIGGPEQTTISHRDYDFAIVSSSSVVPYYAEGFGIAENKVLPLGIPRTDIFFDPDYAMTVRQRFLEEYPGLKGKKIILFAPTFRGNGKLSAYYDKDRFDPNQVIEAMPNDTVLIIKHHPFVKITYDIKRENKDRIYDFSKESEINDLLFITDVLITDYSSVIFEASLLNIPMLFYAYDLREYIATRDIYPEYEMYVPGDIVYTQEQLILALLNLNPDQSKLEDFRKENFEFLDGNSSWRVANKILSIMDDADP